MHNFYMFVVYEQDGRIIGTGITEIFLQEPNMSLVTRDLRAGTLEFQESAYVVHGLSMR